MTRTIVVNDEWVWLQQSRESDLDARPPEPVRVVSDQTLTLLDNECVGERPEPNVKLYPTIFGGDGTGVTEIGGQ